MAIDSNLSTLKILEPIAEEIANIRTLEEGGANPRINLQLEKRNLGVVHLSSIARIYGESGTEILELLKKNPVGAIPVIVKRLKQKDIEWRKARQDLNKGWKELVDKNYDRSFDQQALIFKMQDKRFYSAKNLVGDIKGGNSELEQYLLQVAPGILKEVPAPLVDLLGDMQPHLTLEYDASDQGALRDVYRVVCHAMEVSNMGSSDKERIATLWRDLLRVFFNMPVHFLYGPSTMSTNFTSPEEASDGGMDVISNNEGLAGITAGEDSVPLDPAEAFQSGTRVLTLYGSGRVIGFRSEDNIYQVQLPYGVGFLRPSVVIGAEELPATALEAIGVTTDAQVKLRYASSPFPQNSK